MRTSIDLWGKVSYKQRQGANVNRKRVRISVLLDSEEFGRFDAYCQERGFKKSTLIARLIRDHLDERAFDGQAKPITNQERPS